MDFHFFLRDLLSSSYEALDKIQLESWYLYTRAYYKQESDVFIRIIADKTNNTLTIIDSGVGMKKDDLEKHCTSLKKWLETKEFLKDRATAYDSIPEFGIKPTAADLESTMTKEAQIEATADALLSLFGKRSSRDCELKPNNPGQEEINKALEKLSDSVRHLDSFDDTNEWWEASDELWNEYTAINLSVMKECQETCAANYSIKMYHAASPPGGGAVGFYSAYFIADKVVVTSKQHDDERYVCEVGADGYFTINRGAGEYCPPGVRRLGRGTQITLFLRGEDQLDCYPLYELVSEHAKFIPYPVFLRIEEKNSDEKEQKEEGEVVVDEEEEKKKKHGWSLMPNPNPWWERQQQLDLDKKLKSKDYILQKFETALLESGFMFDEPNTYGNRMHKWFKSELGIDPRGQGEVRERGE